MNKTNAEFSQKVLMIAGMHRSGTSLTANWLQQTGLFIGDDLLVTGTKHSNPSGNHYEDKDFLAFHKRILRDNAYREEGYLTHQTLVTTSAHETRAKEIISTRDSHQEWGWKEPRTTLLMDFWDNLLPDMKVFAVYRHPVLVVDSIMKRALQYPYRRRRWLNKIRNFPQFMARNYYYKVWNRYNTDLLDFAHRFPSRVILLEVDDMLNHGVDVLTYLNTKWGFNLDYVSPDTVFIRDRLSRVDEDNPLNQVQQSSIIADCARTYNELGKLRDDNLERLKHE